MAGRCGAGDKRLRRQPVARRRRAVATDSIDRIARFRLANQANIPFEPQDGPPRVVSPFGHQFLFFVFVSMAFCLFAPIVLLPLIKEHCELLAEEQRLARRHAELQNEIERHDQLLDAFQKDVTINERLAILDLNYQNPREEVLAALPQRLIVPPPPPEKAPVYQSELMIPDAWPQQVREAELWAQQRGLIDLLLDRSLRPVLLLMCGGMVVAAFVLFAPRVPPRGTVLMPRRTPTDGNVTSGADAPTVRPAI